MGSAQKTESSTAGQARAGPPVDTSQALHIEESRRNYAAFLRSPGGYKQYEHLANVQYDHIPGLEKHVYDQHLSYYGQLGFEELLREIAANPGDHENNSDRYGRMLEIIAKMPCELDHDWDGCVVQIVGVTRDAVEKAREETALLLAAQNLVKLREYRAREGYLGAPEAEAYQALYDSLAPVLAGVIDGNDQAARRLGIGAAEAAAIVDDAAHR